jgi:hypothetical protein
MKAVSLLATALLLASSASMAEDSPREQAEHARQQSDAKATKEKAAADRVVEGQRAAEKSAKESNKKEASPTPTPQK